MNQSISVLCVFCTKKKTHWTNVLPRLSSSVTYYHNNVPPLVTYYHNNAPPPPPAIKIKSQISTPHLPHLDFKNLEMAGYKYTYTYFEKTLSAHITYMLLIISNKINISFIKYNTFIKYNIF